MPSHKVCTMTTNNIGNHYDWDLSFLNSDLTKTSTFNEAHTHDFTNLSSKKYITIILNQELPSVLTNVVLSISQGIVCADGGADALLKHMKKQLSISQLEEQESIIKNQLESLKAMKSKQFWVIGDFDSIKKTTLDYMKKSGAEIIPSYDQNTTDLDKSLDFTIHYFNEHYYNNGITNETIIIVLGNFGGRLDHSISNLSTLYRLEKDIQIKLQYQIYLIDDLSLCFVLKSGKNKINLSSYRVSSTCGLLPLLPVKSVTSKGLYWELLNASMEMGTYISSSNKLKNKTVIITSTGPILWYSELTPVLDVDMSQ